jgi:hypothetical protein
MATILDVIDNHFYKEADSSSSLDIRRIPGRALYEFGEEVRRFAQTYVQPTSTSSERPIYIGGWPSASYWAAHGDMLLSSLLYADRILVKDPLSDWFSDDQYYVQHKMSTRTGYLEGGDKPAVAQTRWFLSHVIPALRFLRPLIDAGLVVLVPSEGFLRRNRAAIANLQGQLATSLLHDVAAYSQNFSPAEVAVEDNRRGMFVFAGGEREKQVREALEDGLLYFSREYAFSQAHAATYVAPFRHEMHICQQGLEKTLLPSTKVAHAILQSRLPLFSNLTPKVLAEIHADESFGSFRQELDSVYAGTPVEAPDDEVKAYIADRERVLLEPSIEAARRSADRGLLARSGIVLSGAGFGMAAGIASNWASGAIITGLGAAAAIADAWRNTRHVGGSIPVWTALTKHNKTVTTEMSRVMPQSGSGPTDNSHDYWSIPEQPSMSVTITPGTLLFDTVPGPGESVAKESTGSAEEPYAPCMCGSGLPYKFCCRHIRVGGVR